MGVYIPTGYAMVRFKWQIQGDNKTQISTLGVTRSAAQDPGDAVSEINLEWRQAWNDEQFALGDLFLGCDMIYRDSSGELATVEDNTQLAGQATAPTLPTNCAVPVKKVTAVGGRRNRGRMFLPATYIPETSVDRNGGILNAFRVAWQQHMDAFLLALTAAGSFEHTPVVLHSNPLHTPTPITSFSVGTRIFSTPNRMNN